MPWRPPVTDATIEGGARGRSPHLIAELRGVSAESNLADPEAAATEHARQRRRRSVGLVELLSNSVGAVQQGGLAPFTLAFVILAPTALIGVGLELWLKLPGSVLLVGFLMAAFALYLAAVTPLLVNGEAAARQRSLAATIDYADASLPSLLLGGALSGIVVAAGLELRLLPGFLILGLLALTAPAALREQRGPVSSLRRGLALTQGNAPAFVALGAIIGAAALGIYAALAFVLGPLPGFFSELVAVSATATLAAPTAAHAFVCAFDSRAGGRRLSVRLGARQHAATGASRPALRRTLGSLRHSRTASEQRVAFTSRMRPDSTALRYSPDAATQTYRLPALRDDRAPVPDWAGIEEATVDELHSAV